MNGENPCIKDPAVHKLFFALEPRLCVTRVTRDFKIHYGEALVRLMQPKDLNKSDSAPRFLVVVCLFRRNGLLERIERAYSALLSHESPR